MILITNHSINQMKPATATYILPALLHYWEYCVWAVVWLVEISSFNTNM